MQVIENYLEDLRAQDYSPNTIRAYRYGLAPLKEYDLGTISALDLMVIMGRNKDSNTAASRLAAIKSFFRWLNKNNIVTHDPAATLGTIRTPKTKQVIIPEHDMRLIRSEIKKTPLPVRAFFTLLWDTDIQIYQALSLNTEDIDWQKCSVLDHPLNESAPLLKELCSLQIQGPLFLSSHNERAAYDWAYRWWKKIMKKTNMNYYISNLKARSPVGSQGFPG